MESPVIYVVIFFRKIMRRYCHDFFRDKNLYIFTEDNYTESWLKLCGVMTFLTPEKIDISQFIFPKILDTPFLFRCN